MRPARVALGVALMLLAAGTVYTPTLRAQRQRQVFVSVMDSRGVPVLGLGPDSFKIFENQVEVRTLKVEAIDWPMKVAVLVDNGSGSEDYLGNLRTGLRYFFNEIPDDVELSLLTLAPQPRWVVRPTTDLQKAIKGVDLVAPDTGTASIFDGIAEAAARFDKEKGRYFPVIVVVSSDVGNTEPPLPREYERLNQQTKKNAITVHFVLLSTGTQKTIGGIIGSVQTHIGMALTQLSGGRYQSIGTGSTLATLLPDIGQQIARSHFKQTHQYRVTYEPSDVKESKDLSVSVSANSAVSVEPTIDGHLP